MRSHLTNSFKKQFRNLPERIKRNARKNYRIWKKYHHHPSLNFKLVNKINRIYSVRIGIGWRALGIMNGDNIIWFWIGSHSDYNKLLS